MGARVHTFIGAEPQEYEHKEVTQHELSLPLGMAQGLSRDVDLPDIHPVHQSSAVCASMTEIPGHLQSLHWNKSRLCYGFMFVCVRALGWTMNISRRPH